MCVHVCTHTHTSLSLSLSLSLFLFVSFSLSLLLTHSRMHTHRPNNPAMSPAGPGASSYFNQPPEETQMESVIQPIGLESVLAVILPHLKDFDKLLSRTPEVSHICSAPFEHIISRLVVFSRNWHIQVF